VKAALMEMQPVILESLLSHNDLNVNFGSPEEAMRIEELSQHAKALLSLCGVDPDIFEVQVNMDCSLDEEIARRLEIQEPPRRQRGRRRRA
jgi:hypothetical protein